jgi:hypothetical protein
VREISEKIDLKELEEKAWKTTFEDGLLDIYFGILFLGLTFSKILDEFLPNVSSIIGISIIFGGVIFFILCKRFISQPRIGKVKFGQIRIARKAKTILILTINFFILLIIFLLGELTLLPSYLSGLLVGLLFMALPLFLVAYFLQYNRLYFIALIVGLSFFFEELLALAMVPEPLDGIIAFGIISAIILIMGFIIFINFLKKYPLTK